MMTLSNILVMPDNDKCPTIEDVAVGLGRIPRFVGQTKRWWPVLLHSMVVYEMMLSRADDKFIQLHALWHDAHEAVTEDVPTTWKSLELKSAQRELDLRLWKMLGVQGPYSWQSNLIHELDQEALHAEAFLIGPTKLPAYFGYVGRKPIHLLSAKRIMREYTSPVSTNGANSRAVKKFVELTHTLRKT